MTIPFTSLINSLPAITPFVGPETLERQHGQKFKARIGANESAFGLSPLAATAMQTAIAESHWYADPESFELREALAEKHKVHIDEICVDAGIDSLLGLTVRMLAGPEETVVTSLGAYPTLNYHVAGFGAQLVTVPYSQYREDPVALIAAAKEHSANLVYLSNPDNPMGTWHDAETVAQMIASVPKQCVMALDEAYIDFADDNLAPPIDTSNRNVIRFRTFSKAYGMAGQRIGYAIAHRDLITGFNKIRNHFGINRIAQIGALASLQDKDFLPQVRKSVADARTQVTTFAAQHGFDSLPSNTNFVAVDMGNKEAATAMITELGKRKVFMRMPGVEPLNRFIRVGLGNNSEFKVFKDAFIDVVK